MYRRLSRSFETIGIYNDNVVNLTGTDLEPEQVRIAMTSFEVFEALGVQPVLGRLPGQDDDPNAPTPTLLSWGLWQRRYGGDPSIVGRSIEINGRPRPVTAVMPKSFAFPSPETQVWMRQGYDERERRIGEFVNGSVARLRPGVTIAEAEAELNAIIARMPEALTDVRADWLASSGLAARVEPLRHAMVGGARAPLALTLAAATLVLLLAGANVANLFLIRAEQRSQEIGVCRALGASSRHLFLAFLAEAVIACTVAAGFALLLSRFAVSRIVRQASGLIPRAEEIGVGGVGVAWLAGLVVLTALVLALAGFWRSRGVSLRDPGRRVSSDPAHTRARAWLSGAQVALAFAALCAASLLLRSYWNLTNLDPGFHAPQVVAFDISLPFRGYDTFAKTAAFHGTLDARIGALPEVASAGATFGLPIARSELKQFLDSVVFIERPGQAPLEVADVNWRLATPGYFATMGIPIRAGRWFAPGDHFDASFPIVVSESFARRRLGDAPLGRRLRHFADPNLWTVVGVVGDVHDDGLRAGASETAYVPVLDQTRATPYIASNMTHVVRTTGSTDALIPAVRGIVRQIDPNVPIARVRLMTDIVAESVAGDALILSLVASAAGLAVLVGLVGVAAAMSYTITARRREFGIRLALGATPMRLRGAVLGRACAVALSGVAAGALIVVLASALLESVLFGVRPIDPPTYVASAAGLGVAAAVALLLSSRGLARIQPVEILK
jgi:predicted permease